MDLSENTDQYIFQINYEIDSEFMRNLLASGKAILYLVIQSKDNKFFKLAAGQTSISISKKRISLTRRRTTIQLLIRADEEISFQDNQELNSFYDSYKADIVVPKHAILGFSNTVLFDGSCTKPFELFEKKVDASIKSPVKVELGTETIIICYQDAKYQFVDSSQCSTLNNIYIYMGLQKALYRFIINNSDDQESVDIEEMEYPENPLDCKLYSLMQAKRVSELTIHNIDEVITMISDRVIDRFTTAVRGLYQ